MPASKNVSLLRSLLLEADGLASHAAKNQFPVLLRPIAEKRRVTSVEFRPLLVDAMLTTHPKGFRILFNSDNETPSELQIKYQNESRDRILGSRLRFSLAHEIAHTFFYNLSQPEPKLIKKFSPGGGRTALENLEINCNRLASRLLLPTAMLRAGFLKLKNITPQSILELANEAGVSVEVLIRRINDYDSLFIQRYFKGSIILAETDSFGLKIRAVAKHEGLDIAHGLNVMHAGNAWLLKAADGSEINPINAPSSSVVALNVKTERSTVKKYYAMSVMESRKFDSQASYLMTFEEKQHNEVKKFAHTYRGDLGKSAE